MDSNSLEAARVLYESRYPDFSSQASFSFDDFLRDEWIPTVGSALSGEVPPVLYGQLSSALGSAHVAAEYAAEKAAESVRMSAQNSSDLPSSIGAEQLARSTFESAFSETFQHDAFSVDAALMAPSEIVASSAAPVAAPLGCEVDASAASVLSADSKSRVDSSSSHSSSQDVMRLFGIGSQTSSAPAVEKPASLSLAVPVSSSEASFASPEPVSEKVSAHSPSPADSLAEPVSSPDDKLSQALPILSEQVAGSAEHISVAPSSLIKPLKHPERVSSFPKLQESADVSLSLEHHSSISPEDSPASKKKSKSKDKPAPVPAPMPAPAPAPAPAEPAKPSEKATRLKELARSITNRACDLARPGDSITSSIYGKVLSSALAEASCAPGGLASLRDGATQAYLQIMRLACENISDPAYRSLLLTNANKFHNNKSLVSSGVSSSTVFSPPIATQQQAALALLAAPLCDSDISCLRDEYFHSSRPLAYSSFLDVLSLALLFASLSHPVSSMSRPQKSLLGSFAKEALSPKALAASSD